MTSLLTIRDISNIFAISSFTLLLTSILLNPPLGKLSLQVKNKKIKNALWVSVSLFLMTMIIRVFEQLLFV
jgi:hypothetical protein